MQPEGHFGDHTKRAERSAEQLAEIVARDVLDDFASTARDGSVGEHDLHSDHEIPQSTVVDAQYSGVVRR
jgi:hypothetical protein